MKDHILYLECNSGISGDMTVAALLDLGADRQVLMDALESLPLSGYTIEIKNVFKHGIRACDFDVILAQDNHDHDMEYLHGNHSTCSSTFHQETPVSESITAHTEPVHVHHHDARNLHDIEEIILAGNLTPGARALALRIFRILAEAEAAVHGKSIEEVHFHEVGAIDSIVDIVSVAICMDNLQPVQIVISPLTDGHGQIRCRHGLIPVPVPAVVAIAVGHGLILRSIDVDGELVTPTGAAIAAAIPTQKKLPPEYIIRKVGLGAGKREYPTSGLLRAMLIEPGN